MITFDDLIEAIPNKYLLTVIAGKRFREIMTDKKGTFKIDPKTTVVRHIFNEIVSGKIKVKKNEK